MTDETAPEPTTYTDSALSDKVKKFLTSYKDKDTKLYKYVDAIDEMMSLERVYIIIDFDDLVEEEDIVKMFMISPDRIFAAFARAIKEALQTRFLDYAEKIKNETRARLINFPLHNSLRKVNAKTIGKVISVSGMVVRASEVQPLAKKLAFTCDDGHVTTTVQRKGMDTKTPVICDSPDCKRRDFELDPESSSFIDFQIIRLQELPEDLPPGQMPHYIDVTIREDLVDNTRPGDRIILTGIVRVEQESLNGIRRGQSGLYRLRIEGNNIEFLSGKGSKTDRKIAREDVSPEEEKQILTLAAGDKIYDNLIDSFAPHIQGQRLIKEAILLLIVGAKQRQLTDGTKIRGDINVFLVGDPGTAKSEMLKFCSRIAPRGMYTSGRGSTAAGLTAAVTRDKTGIMMLEAGAVVLGDQGMVSIDEFDKMKAEDRSALHEVMEQQSASIAKGGIVATLNARTSILAAANPLFGKYDPFKNITENINLPIPLLTRFDLIFIVRDIPGAERDEKIAKHIIARNTSDTNGKKSVIDVDILTKYLTYAKRQEPTLTPDAEKKILTYYLQMRKVESEEMITVTPRQLEGIVRLSTARARLLMKSKVEEEDADRAIFLIQSMLADVGVDVNTGKVDVGVLQGKPRSEVSKLTLFLDVLKMLEGDTKIKVDERLFITELEKTGKFTKEDAKDFIKKMLRDASIYESYPGCYNRV